MQPAEGRIAYFALGGTIASTDDGADRGAAPRLGAGELLDAVPNRAGIGPVDAVQLVQRPSPEITIRDLLRLRDAIGAAVSAGAVGAVVSHGTDTLEESAFALDLLWPGPEPVVFTGAMRTPPGNDGPANLEAALRVAAAPAAAGFGSLVVMQDEIHAARFVRKADTAALPAFRSPGLGPLGRVAEGRVIVSLRPASRSPSIDLAADARIPAVALVVLAMGDDDRMLKAVEGLGFAGLVVAGFGGGHVRAAMVPALRDLARRMPVVLASRTGAGPILSRTYGFAGGEIDLLDAGLVPAGLLDAAKAKVLLTLCLAAGLGREAIAQRFAGFAT